MGFALAGAETASTRETPAIPAACEATAAGSSDSTTPYARFNDYWSRWTDLGVHGDARTATAAKGEVIFEAAVGGIVEFVEEWRAWPIAERRDFHTNPVQRGIRW